MSYTYLITGATSDVGRALIERLLQNAPADTLVLAQGCGADLGLRELGKAGLELRQLLLCGLVAGCHGAPRKSRRSV